MLCLLCRCCICWLLAGLRLSGSSATRVRRCRVMLDLTFFVIILEKVWIKVKLGFVTCIVACLASRSGLFNAIGSCIRSCVGRYLHACWMAAATGSRVTVGHRVWTRQRGGSCVVRYLHIRTRLLLPSFCSCVGWYPHACWVAAAAGSRVSVGYRVWTRQRGGSCVVRFLHIRTRLQLPSLRLLFDKENVAALMNHGVDDSHDLVYSSSDVGTDEGLNRHVFAGSLFSGTGEQASGRVDVPGKDNQQHAAAANETICFFVKSLGGASYVVKMEHHATVARVKQHVALKSGVPEDAFYLVWEGRVLRDGDTLGRLGVVRDTQLHMCSYLRGGVGMGRQPQIPGQLVCQSCGMGGCWPTRQSCYRCGAPRLGGIGGQRPPRETHYPGQPSNQGLPINPTKRASESGAHWAFAFV